MMAVMMMMASLMSHRGENAGDNQSGAGEKSKFFHLQCSSNQNPKRMKGAAAPERQCAARKLPVRSQRSGLAGIV
jgi:hypothetical protein